MHKPIQLDALKKMGTERLKKLLFESIEIRKLRARDPQADKMSYLENELVRRSGEFT